jgi:hypothetical protein
MFFALLMSLSLQAAVIDRLPIVTAETFVPGRSWVWTYYEDETVYSTEKYTVLSRQGSVVRLEMASHYGQETEFKAHHRLEVDIAKCLDAHSRRHDYRGWSIKMFHLNAGRWELIDNPQHTKPFEEKFNCDPHVRTERAKATVIGRDLRGNHVFQQRRYGVDKGTWFHLEGEEGGTAAFKRMGPTYHFELTR